MDQISNLIFNSVTFFLVLIFLYVSQARIPRSQIGSHRIMTCFGRTNTSPDDLKIVGRLPDNHTKVDDVLCFFKCLCEECGVIRDGEIFAENVREFPVIKEDMNERQYQDAKICLESAKTILRVENCKDMSRIIVCLSYLMPANFNSSFETPGVDHLFKGTDFESNHR